MKIRIARDTIGDNYNGYRSLIGGLTVPSAVVTANEMLVGWPVGVSKESQSFIELRAHERERAQCSSGCGVLERAPVGGGGGVGGDSKNHTIHKKFSSSGQFSEENGAVHSVLMECCCCCRV